MQRFTLFSDEKLVRSWANNLYLRLQRKRLIKLNQIAIQQMSVLQEVENRKLLRQKYLFYFCGEYEQYNKLVTVNDRYNKKRP
jgi:hypothetical protein